LKFPRNDLLRVGQYVKLTDSLNHIDWLKSSKVNLSADERYGYQE